MKKKFLLYAMTALLCLSSCQSNKEKRIENYLRTFIQQYPEVTLQDIYKGSFQDVFGPAHILTNRDAVKNYIQYELKAATRLEGPAYEPCGWQGNFLQVNLKVIADGRVPMDDFVDAFMASANGIDTTLTQSFIEDWYLIQQAVRAVKPSLEGFEKDSTLLSNLLKEGKYVVHHSRKFNAHYHPHYRIIRKDLFEEKILPRLK
jgi:hypothetical protein